MKVTSLQAILSILVVGIFVIISAVIALTPVIGGYPPQPYTELLKTYSTLFSGIVGLVIGFFFGKRTAE